MIAHAAPSLLVDPSDLAARVARLEAKLAQEGWAQSDLHEAEALADEAAAVAHSVTEDLPAEAVGLIDASRRVEGAALRAEGDDEQPLVDALDALHTMLLAIRENAPVAQGRPLTDVVAWLVATLGVSQEELARAIDVAPRTLQRWLGGETPVPPAAERRLRLALQGLNDVRFALRGRLALAWLRAPVSHSGGRTPLELLDEPEAFRRAVMALRF
jgi:DNA-binding transcriptional regulator YiaG